MKIKTMATIGSLWLHRGALDGKPATHISEVAQRDLAFWARSGFNVFRIPPDLWGALSLTEPVDHEMAPPPYDSFVVDLGADSILVAGTPGLQGRAVRQIVVTAGPFWRLTLFGENMDQVALDDESDPLPNESVCSIGQIVRNLCAWIAQARPATTKNVRRTAYRPRGRVRAEPVVWHFDSVKLSPSVKEAALAASRGDREGVSFAIKKQFLVRGHFRRQPHGPGRGERKTIWIAPHWKGPEGAEAWAHIYETAD